MNFVLAMEVADLFFDAVDAEVARVQPVGRVLPAEAERALARVCYVLGVFEIAYRSPTHADEPLLALLKDWLNRALEARDGLSRADQQQFNTAVLALVRDEWVDDLCQLSGRFLERCAPLLSQSVVLNPTFVGSRDVGGADADLIVDHCLLEIKTTIRSAIDAQWMHQLIGYVLLEYDDTYTINSVGFYLARHGVLRSWPLQECLDALTCVTMWAPEQCGQGVRRGGNRRSPHARRSWTRGVSMATVLIHTGWEAFRTDPVGYAENLLKRP